MAASKRVSVLEGHSARVGKLNLLHVNLFTRDQFVIQRGQYDILMTKQNGAYLIKFSLFLNRFYGGGGMHRQCLMLHHF